MASSKKISMGVLLLQIVLAAYLIICGIMAFQMVTQPQDISGFFQKAGASLSNSGSALSSVYDVFENDDVSKAIVIGLGSCEILIGIFLVLTIVLSLGQLEGILYIFAMIIYLVVILFVNILGDNGLINNAFKNQYTTTAFLSSIISNLLVLSALFMLKKK